MKKKLLYLMLIVLSTWTLIGCGKDQVVTGESLAEANKNSIIQFNSELVTDNTMYVIEDYIYPTAIADYVNIKDQMEVKIMSIACPDGTIWNGDNEYSRLQMFETYSAADEPYIITFKENFTSETNTLLVYCYSKEQAVEKGMIANVIPFTFKDFIKDNQLNVVQAQSYSLNFEDYLDTETLDTIEITRIYNYLTNEEFADWVLEDYTHKMLIPTGCPPEGQIPFTWMSLTFTDTSCNYSETLYINVYPKEADTTGVLLAPTLE